MAKIVIVINEEYSYVGTGKNIEDAISNYFDYAGELPDFSSDAIKVYLADEAVISYIVKEKK